MAEKIEILLQNGRAFFHGKYPRDLVDDCISAKVEGAQFSPQFKKKQWDGYTRFLSRTSNSFPIGLTTHVKTVLEEAGYEVDVWNNELAAVEDALDPGVAANVWDGFDMVTEAGEVVFRDYQIEAGKAYLSGKSDTPYRSILHMGTGCHAKGQGIMLYSGRVVSVEDVQEGDLLMGMDSRPRKVLRLIRGKGQMYKITPSKGASFVVNEDHVLSLRKTAQDPCSSAPSRRGGSVVDVSVKTYLSWSAKQKHLYKLFRVPVDMEDTALPVDPYLLGILLGDGHIGKSSINLTSADKEVSDYFVSAVKNLGNTVRVQAQPNNASTVFHVLGRGTNGLRDKLRSLGLLGTTSSTKFIPPEYKNASFENRKAILAGLIDTDGHYSNGGYDYVSKSEALATDVAFIARSLGLAAYVTQCEKRCQTGGGGVYYRVSISGDCSIVPCRIKRKKAAKRIQKKDVLVTGFTLEKLGVDYFYGFTLDGDGRYLLDDFTVTHNSGKTYVAAGIAYSLNQYGEVRTLFLVHGKELVQQTYRAFIKVFEPEVVGICMGDVWNPSLITIASVDTIYSRLKAEDDEVLDLLASIVFIIADECHRASSKSWALIIDKANAPFRLGLSGTPMKRQDERDLRLLATTGPVVYHLETSTLQEGGYVSLADLTTVIITQPEMRSLPWQDAFRSLIVSNTNRTRIIADLAIKRAREGKTVLILAGNSVQFAKNIHARISAIHASCAVVTGVTKAEETNKAFDALRDKKLDILVTTLLADEGVDVPAVNVLMLVGGGKCLSPDTPVLLHTGERIEAQHVEVGMELMGPDSLPRKVLSTISEEDLMYKIVPVKGNPFTCTKDHILTLVESVSGKVHDISVEEYLALGARGKDYKLVRSECIHFPRVSSPLVEPYFLGLWFGDGTKQLLKNSRVSLTTMDSEIIDYCEALSRSYGLHLTKLNTTKKGKASEYSLSNKDNTNRFGSRKMGHNKLLTDLRYCIGDTERIPDSVKYGSERVRLEFLAGFMDTDGHLHHGFFEISQKRKDYADDISFIARSLGFMTTEHVKIVRGTSYYRVNICGDVSRIPCRLPRKQAGRRKTKKNPLRCGFSVVPVGLGAFSGFTLDRDGRFLLGDFTITHNSYVKAIQRVGRGLRKKEDGTSLEVIEFLDLTNKFLEKHAQARLDYYTEANIFQNGIVIEDISYVFSV